MSGGEADAYALNKQLKVDYEIKVNTPVVGKIEHLDSNIVNGNATTTSNTVWVDPYTTTWPNQYYYWSTTWPTTIYLYQIRCPKKSCKTYNWLELDKITPCTKCKSRLKAVSNTADYEIPVNN